MYLSSTTAIPTRHWVVVVGGRGDHVAVSLSVLRKHLSAHTSQGKKGKLTTKSPPCKYAWKLANIQAIFDVIWITS